MMSMPIDRADEGPLWAIFVETCNTFSGNVAIREGSQSLTYDGLASLARSLGAAVDSLLDHADRLVGLSVGRGLPILVCLLSVLSTGRGYVPVDPDYPAARRHYLYEDSGVRLVLTSEPQSRDSRILLPLPWGGGIWGTMLAPERPARLVREQTAYVIYTSGTTGSPKGCIVNQAHVVEMLGSVLGLYEFRATDVWSLFHSYSFDFSVWEMWGAIACGATMIGVPLQVAMDPVETLSLLGREGVTVVSQVPASWAHLLDAYSRGLTRLDRLRLVILGGEVVLETQTKRWFKCDLSRQATLLNLYGITEITVHATALALDAQNAVFDLGSPIGYPLGHVEISIRDANGRAVPDGDVGEIWVEGPSVCDGYLGQPALTRMRFQYTDRKRAYRSGDLARRGPAGALYYLGRVDNQLKIRGHRIEVAEVESALLRVAEVSEAVVVACNLNGTASLCAFVRVEPRNADRVSAASLRSALAHVLPRYARPTRYTFLDKVPLTANNKIDRARLERWFEASVDVKRKRQDSG